MARAEPIFDRRHDPIAVIRSRPWPPRIRRRPLCDNERFGGEFEPRFRPSRSDYRSGFIARVRATRGGHTTPLIRHGMIDVFPRRFPFSFVGSARPAATHLVGQTGDKCPNNTYCPVAAVRA